MADTFSLMKIVMPVFFCTIVYCQEAEVHPEKTCCTLLGTVHGKGGGSKKFVRIEIGDTTLYTNENSSFVLELEKGKHEFVFKEKNKNCRFKIKIHHCDTLTKTFKLKWY